MLWIPPSLNLTRPPGPGKAGYVSHPCPPQGSYAESKGSRSNVTWPGGFTRLIAAPGESCCFPVTISLLPELLCTMVKLICAGEPAAQWCYKFSPCVFLNGMFSSQIGWLLDGSFWNPMNSDHISLAGKRACRKMQQGERQCKVSTGCCENERWSGKVASFLCLF